MQNNRNSKQHYEYAIESIYDKRSGGTNRKSLAAILEKYSSDGWRLAAVFTNELGKNEAPIMGININATMDEVVLIFERNLHEYHDRHEVEHLKTVEPQMANAAIKGKTTWYCTKCQHENESYAGYCVICGEIQHHNWKCGQCESTNSRYNNYCFKCGKARTLADEESYLESVSSSSRSAESIPDDISRDDLEIINGYQTTTQIIDFCKSSLPNNADTDALLHYLTQRMNRDGQNDTSFDSNKKVVEAFYRNGCIAFDVKNGSRGSMIACPKCGITQKSDRSVCMRCLALFR